MVGMTLIPAASTPAPNLGKNFVSHAAVRGITTTALDQLAPVAHLEIEVQKTISLMLSDFAVLLEKNNRPEL